MSVPLFVQLYGRCWSNGRRRDRTILGRSEPGRRKHKTDEYWEPRRGPERLDDRLELEEERSRLLVVTKIRRNSSDSVPPAVSLPKRLQKARIDLEATGEYFDEFTAGVRELNSVTLKQWEGLSTTPVKNAKGVESVYRLRESESTIKLYFNLVFAD